MKYCLLVIDVQKGVFGLKQPVYGAEGLIRNINKAIGVARRKGASIVFGMHENGGFLKKGTEGHEIADGIEALESDIVIAKKRPDIFEGTGLDDMLKEKGVSDVIVAGLISNGCVKNACLSAFNRGYNVILLGDAHSTFYKDAANMIDLINREMEEAGVRVLETDELYVLL